MNGPVEGGSGGELTLVFALTAIEAFENPSEVFADAREWSQHIGVVANDTTAVKSYLAAHGLHQDFDLGERDKWMTMANIRETATTNRYVFIGASPEDQRVAAHTGWDSSRILKLLRRLAGHSQTRRMRPQGFSSGFGTTSHSAHCNCPRH